MHHYNMNLRIFGLNFLIHIVQLYAYVADVLLYLSINYGGFIKPIIELVVRLAEADIFSSSRSVTFSVKLFLATLFALKVIELI